MVKNKEFQLFSLTYQMTIVHHLYMSCIKNIKTTVTCKQEHIYYHILFPENYNNLNVHNTCLH